jgi:chorismate synthase
LTAIVEGVPAGVKIITRDLDTELARRQLGYGRGGRMKIEKDKARITGGVRHGVTIGSPIAMRISNRDWKNWREVMSVSPLRKSATKKVSIPRPGHADLSGLAKYGLDDIRSVLERASARETAARVGVGAIARKLLSGFDIEIFSHVTRIGKVKARSGKLDFEALGSVDESPVRCLDKEAAESMKREIDSARKGGESLGGVFEVVVTGLVPGIGSYTTGDARLDGRLGGALMSIPAIKGAEIGDGFSLAAKPGSRAHDEIFFSEKKGFYRRTNRSGGLEGGMTTGAPLVARASMKPIPTLTKPLRSVDTATGASVAAHKERSDVCAVPAAAVVAEAMVAIVIADAFLDKFGGDCLADVKEAYLGYLRRIRSSWLRR